MKIIGEAKDSVGVKSVIVAPTEYVRPGDRVWVVWVMGYEDDHHSLYGIYTSWESADQAMRFYVNIAPNHVEAYVELLPLQSFHPGGKYRIW